MKAKYELPRYHGVTPRWSFFFLNFAIHKKSHRMIMKSSLILWVKINDILPWNSTPKKKKSTYWLIKWLCYKTDGKPHLLTPDLAVLCSHCDVDAVVLSSAFSQRFLQGLCVQHKAIIEAAGDVVHLQDDGRSYRSASEESSWRHINSKMMCRSFSLNLPVTVPNVHQNPASLSRGVASEILCTLDYQEVGML